MVNHSIYAEEMQLGHYPQIFINNTQKAKLTEILL